jgi:hypothetical protein
MFEPGTFCEVCTPMETWYIFWLKNNLPEVTKIQAATIVAAATKFLEQHPDVNGDDIRSIFSYIDI